MAAAASMSPAKAVVNSTQANTDASRRYDGHVKISSLDLGSEKKNYTGTNQNSDMEMEAQPNGGGCQIPRAASTAVAGDGSPVQDRWWLLIRALLAPRVPANPSSI